MQRHRWVIIVLALALLAGLALYPLRFQPQPLAGAELLTSGNPLEYGYSTMVLHLAKPVELAPDQEVQFSVGGNWLSWKTLHSLPEPSSTEVKHIVAPLGTERCRFRLTYRQRSLRDELCFFLVRHHWWHRAPSLCQWLIQRLPAHRAWRHGLLEYELPKQPEPPRQRSDFVHNERPAVDAGWRLLFAFVCQRPRATQAER
jgi:hypothetical protein